MDVYLETLGCRLNYSEIETLGRQLIQAGHRLVQAPDEADICVLNTCAVTGEAARKSRQLTRRLARANPSARLVVTGCYATLAPQTVAKLPNVRLVVDNSRKELLADLLQPWSAELDGESWRRLVPDAPVHEASRTRAFVKVQDGCNNRCTFCIVTVARGQERSRTVNDVVTEIRHLASKGVQEAVLTGVHLGGYGHDLGTNLHELVSTILRDTELPRLRLSSLEPWDLTPGFFDLWMNSQGRLCPHLHLPLQAGSDRILRRMARRNRTEDFRRLVTEARARIAGLVVTTDVICGFPGETQADFDESLAFLEEMSFAHIHVFPYSAREGTAAADFDGRVPMEERRRRVAAVKDVARRTGRAVRRGFLGSIRPVLWEAQEQPANGVGTTWTGLTDNYLRVRTVAPPDATMENQVAAARLVRLDGDVLYSEPV